MLAAALAAVDARVPVAAVEDSSWSAASSSALVLPDPSATSADSCIPVGGVIAAFVRSPATVTSIALASLGVTDGDVIDAVEPVAEPEESAPGAGASTPTYAMSRADAAWEPVQVNEYWVGSLADPTTCVRM